MHGFAVDGRKKIEACTDQNTVTIRPCRFCDYFEKSEKRGDGKCEQ